MKIDIKVQGIKELQANLKEFSERRVRSTVATAMTRTAVMVRDQLQSKMASALDRPTAYTRRNLRYTAATAKGLQASVGFDIVANQDMYGKVTGYTNMGRAQTPVGKYMNDQIEGGPRRNKRFENALRRVGVLPAGWFAVPGQRAKVDAFGNQSPGEIRQILSWFDAAELVRGSTQNMRVAGRERRMKGTRKKAGWEYVLFPVGAVRQWARTTSAGPGRGRHKMQPGIYRRSQLDMGPGMKSRLEPIMIFVKSARYRSRWDFYGDAKRAVDRIYPAEIDKAIAEAFKALAERARAAT